MKLMNQADMSAKIEAVCRLKLPRTHHRGSTGVSRAELLVQGTLLIHDKAIIRTSKSQEYMERISSSLENCEGTKRVESDATPRFSEPTPDNKQCKQKSVNFTASGNGDDIYTAHI